ncbi:hypothetical protein SISNIDRAFT_542721 [Sistotremastrum niveocremeum HHB9708]|uniref:Uncharacterized protein n=1 Tax=Sistotremastrum niveocremeum HHB9708 TaxID=1314777 RepID=A0A164MGK0_9AGAM|nr:hypothetical protein SISNIDRAFT_542721 [Sistotremastrum niveocremeum HHB9708]
MCGLPDDLRITASWALFLSTHCTNCQSDSFRCMSTYTSSSVRLQFVLSDLLRAYLVCCFETRRAVAEIGSYESKTMESEHWIIGCQEPPSDWFYPRQQEPRWTSVSGEYSSSGGYPACAIDITRMFLMIYRFLASEVALTRRAFELCGKTKETPGHKFMAVLIGKTREIMDDKMAVDDAGCR